MSRQLTHLYVQLRSNLLMQSTFDCDFLFDINLQSVVTVFIIFKYFYGTLFENNLTAELFQRSRTKLLQTGFGPSTKFFHIKTNRA